MIIYQTKLAYMRKPVLKTFIRIANEVNMAVSFSCLEELKMTVSLVQMNIPPKIHV